MAEKSPGFLGSEPALLYKVVEQLAAGNVLENKVPEKRFIKIKKTN